MTLAGARPARKQDTPPATAPDQRPDAADLLAWYDRHRRDLPWRAARGETPDPYQVWLSEIMLQQTTVKTVGPYFERFLARWPNVRALAAAPLEDVLRLWAGLGYYARARNLHACAQAVAHAHRGRFPATEAQLADLPGVGPYTAAAIAAIAFGVRTAAVDGNVERVVARLFAVEQELPAAKPEIRALAEAIVPAERAGDFAQAVMDLGATICTPKRPACALCPWMKACAARRRGDPSPGGDDQGAVGANQCGTESLDDPPVGLTVCGELREVVVKSGVDHTVRHRCSTAQAFQVVQVAAMHLRASRGQRLCARIGARHTEHLMACMN